MKSEFVNQLMDAVEAQMRSRPSPMEFEMAYQARIATDRIKFAMKQTEQAAGRLEQIREAAMLLLDALDRLDSIERRFQQRSRCTLSERKANGSGTAE